MIEGEALSDYLAGKANESLKKEMLMRAAAYYGQLHKKGVYCRPTHFRGVTTVVAKLFIIVQPHVALFGRKDFQQLAVIRRLTADLNLPVEIVGMPIVREADGLAMSSRNVYLSAGERQQALALNAVLRESALAASNGECEPQKITASAIQRLAAEPDLKLDYVKICHAQTLEEVDRVDQYSVMLLAVTIGKTRLIDNRLLLSPSGS